MLLQIGRDKFTSVIAHEPHAQAECNMRVCALHPPLAAGQHLPSVLCPTGSPDRCWPDCPPRPTTQILGGEVDLETILRFPEANQLFIDHLTKELCDENVRFWHEADDYETRFMATYSRDRNASAAAEDDEPEADAAALDEEDRVITEEDVELAEQVTAEYKSSLLQAGWLRWLAGWLAGCF